MKAKKVLAVILAIIPLCTFFVRGTAEEKYNNEWILTTSHGSSYSYYTTSTYGGCGGEPITNETKTVVQYFFNSREAKVYFQMVKTLYDQNCHKYYNPTAKTVRELLSKGLYIYDLLGAAGVINISKAAINVGITILENKLPSLFEEYFGCSKKNEVEELFMKLRDCTNGNDSFSANSLKTGLKVTRTYITKTTNDGYGFNSYDEKVENYNWNAGSSKQLVGTAKTKGTWQQVVRSDFPVY